MQLGKALENAAKEIAGLFVDDRYFALAIAAWIVVLAVASHVAHAASGMLGIGFFFGLATILIVSVARAARRQRS